MPAGDYNEDSCTHIPAYRRELDPAVATSPKRMPARRRSRRDRQGKSTLTQLGEPVAHRVGSIRPVDRQDVELRGQKKLELARIRFGSLQFGGTQSPFRDDQFGDLS